MICPSCHVDKQLRVLETNQEGEVTLRRRECKACSHRFNTCEAVTHVKGTRPSKTKYQSVINKMKVGNSIAASKVGGKVRLISQVEASRQRAERTRRRRDAEDLEKYYSDEYVDTLVPDEEIKDLVDLFGEYD